MKPTRIAIDMSSIMWTCLRVGKDAEGEEVDFEGEKVWVNSAAYGYENTVNSIVKALKEFRLTPEAMIMVFEGASSLRRRLLIDQSYKGTRPAKCPQAYAQFQALLQQLKETFGKLGAIAVSQEGVEGDDILGFLAANTEEPLLIMTNDGDLAVLNGRNSLDVEVVVRVNGEVGVNPCGFFDTQLITTYKATVGDKTDNIKGCPGWGEAKFTDFIAKYGEDGMYELQGLLEQGSLAALHDLPECKLLKMLLNNEAQVLRCYKLAKIHPEWVNTRMHQLQWSPGMVMPGCMDERLMQWQGEKTLVTNANLEKKYEFLLSQLDRTRYFPFDIETSTPEESDEWLERKGDAFGVDTLGSEITGFSLTFGDNHQYTYYICVDHRDTDNISMEDARYVLEAVFKTGKEIVIQNTQFEGPVLHETVDNGIKWSERWKDNGYRGFIPNWLDTAFEASYVNENVRRGLKDRSQMHLGYTQTTFDEVACKTGMELELPTGGRVKKYNLDGTVVKQYKMRELTGAEVFHYGADDSICTGALHNFYKLHMQLDHHWRVYLEVEIAASYQHAKNFLDGAPYSLERMKELEKEDDATYDLGWGAVRSYLMDNGWDGTVPPTYTTSITAKEIKEAYAIYLGVDASEDDEEAEPVEADDGPAHPPEAAPEKDALLSSRVRTPSKFVGLAQSLGHDLFASALSECLTSDAGAAAFTAWIRTRFSGEPKFKVSNKQMGKLLYETMALPIRVWNKPTAKMKAEGKKVGSPMTNALAVKYALQDADETQTTVLEGLQLVNMIKVRRSLYYSKYPYMIHWKTGRVHSSHNQCSTNTRRASASNPNFQQLPKHPKIEGHAAKFRETFIPHKKNAIIVSLDFSQIELRIIADYSRDPNMVACYVGDNRKDMHSLTGWGIFKGKNPQYRDWSYETFTEVLEHKEHELHLKVKDSRAKGKTCNFSTEFGAAAPKLAQTMLILEDEAQEYIDVKEATFPEVRIWKNEVIEEAKQNGYVLTMLGAKRHLSDALNSEDRFTASKAERQAVNFKVQSSSAEMTKKAEGEVWKAGLTYNYDAICLGPIHDELVFSVMLDELETFLIDAHACMVKPYAKMWIPIESSISFGPNFGTQIEIGVLPTAEAVNKGLLKMREAA